MASKHYHFKFNFDRDSEIISRIEAQDNKNDYIRSLILSDMAADILRDSIKLEDVKEDFIGGSYPSIFKPVDTDDVSFYYHEKINWFNEHCPAVGDPDYDCIGCHYFKHHKDDFFSDAGYCDAEAHFEQDMKKISEYFKAGGAMRDYPAEFKGLKKDEDYMVNLHKISKTQLNSLYGKMVSNASNALDNDFKKGDPDNG